MSSIRDSPFFFFLSVLILMKRKLINVLYIFSFFFADRLIILFFLCYKVCGERGALRTPRLIICMLSMCDLRKMPKEIIIFILLWNMNKFLYEKAHKKNNILQKKYNIQTFTQRKVSIQDSFLVSFFKAEVLNISSPLK